MATQNVNESYDRCTVLGELKALPHKLMACEICVVDLDLSTLFEHNEHTAQKRKWHEG